MNLNQPLSSASQLVDEAIPLLKDAVDQVSALAQQCTAAARKEAHDLSLQAQSAKLATTRYIRNEPIKSVLVAAATGAALMALFSLLGHARNGHGPRDHQK